MDLQQFDFDLPAELVAQYPLQNRSSSRLLCFDADLRRCTEYRFADLVELLQAGDMLVVNDTRVVPARLHASKPTGGQIEIMLERLLEGNHALVQLRANKTVRLGQVLLVGDYKIEVIGRQHRFYVIRFDSDVDPARVFAELGSIPLPPYINRPPINVDSERYQTVFCRAPGAVAAPTAGLHLDQTLIRQLKDKGVLWESITLHVGAGTFLPIQGDTLEGHKMHAERVIISPATCDRINAVRCSGGRIVAVGTTVVRSLESAALDGRLKGYDDDTGLFITPGFRFRVVDMLITNFHLPRSSLLVMVSAFAGHQKIKDMYRYGIENCFRFFSYGDAMLLKRAC